MHPIPHLIAILEALEKQIDRLTLQKAHDEVSAIFKFPDGSFYDAAVKQGILNSETEQFDSSPPSQKFREAENIFLKEVVNELKDAVGRAFNAQLKELVPGGDFGRRYVGVVGNCKNGITKTIAILKKIPPPIH